MSTDIRCPKCGSETVVRTAKKGSKAGYRFHVCINYPECKGKVPIPTKKQIDADVILGGLTTVRCPLCYLRGVETMATARYVRGFLIVVQFASYPVTGCVPCVRGELLKQAFLSLLVGWFSLRALILNPFFILYNVIRALTLRRTLTNVSWKSQPDGLCGATRK